MKNGERNMWNQQWSKVKKKLESFLCDSLKDRVNFIVTNYRKTHDQLGRAFITVDKKEVLNMCTITTEMALYRKIREIKKERQLSSDDSSQNLEIWEIAHETVKKEVILAQYDFFDAVEKYFQLSIGNVLQSENMIIKILGLLDRRVGKRTLKSLKESMQQEKEIVQYFYRLRCEAERV